ncbi:MAG: hypothetical protein ACOH2H_19190 [Cypionkella sp.]
MEQHMSPNTPQQGSIPQPQGQQQAEAGTVPQQNGGAKPAPKPQIRDWAAI